MSDHQLQMICRSLSIYCEELKKSQHSLLIKILSYLPLHELIRTVSKVTRKLYIVTGDTNLLLSYKKVEEPILFGRPDHDEESKSNHNKQFEVDTDNISFN